jgi:hypothetical protein
MILLRKRRREKREKRERNLCLTLPCPLLFSVPFVFVSASSPPFRNNDRIAFFSFVVCQNEITEFSTLA